MKTEHGKREIAQLSLEEGQREKGRERKENRERHPVTGAAAAEDGF